MTKTINIIGASAHHLYSFWRLSRIYAGLRTELKFYALWWNCLAAVMVSEMKQGTVIYICLLL